MKKLHLILKWTWYLQVKSGYKKIEYRANTPFWRRRILTDAAFLVYENIPTDKRIFGESVPKEFLKHSVAVFHKSYTKETMTFEIQKVMFTEVVTAAVPFAYDQVIEIHLGARLTEADLNEVERLIANRPKLDPPAYRWRPLPENPQWR